MYPMNEQEKKIYHHIMAIFELVENSVIEDKHYTEMTREEMDQEEFNSHMKENMVVAMDYLGTRIGRRVMSKEFGVHIG